MNKFEVFEIKEYIGAEDIERHMQKYLESNNREIVSISVVYNPNQHCYLLFAVLK